MSTEMSEELPQRRPDTDTVLASSHIEGEDFPMPLAGLINLPLSPLDSLAEDNQPTKRSSSTGHN